MVAITIGLAAQRGKPVLLEVPVAADLDGAQRLAAAAVGPDAYAAMDQEFTEAVASGTPHQLDARHGLRLQEITEEARTDFLRTS